MPEGAISPVEPFREWILKLFERCNLACDHCYMYEAADQHWRGRPMVMADATVAQVARRLSDYCLAHRLDRISVILHGGEPLLAGKAMVARTIDTIRAQLAPHATPSFVVQTNGILLDEEFLRLFRRYGVRVGVSLDGSRAANDRHRRYASGRSSFDAVVRGIDLLRHTENLPVYGGILCTVDVANDPLETYQSLLRYEPPEIDFLLPHGNWVYPPPLLDPTGTHTRYADWLIAIFDRYYDAPAPGTAIRLFDSIIRLLLGGASDTEAIGPGIPAAVTVESDGSIEGSDGLKVTAPSGGATGWTVFTHSFDEAARHPSIAAARQGPAGLGSQCRQCPIVDICGGGLYAHRFAADGRFAAPSVYCRDLYRLVAHARGRVSADLSERAGSRGRIAQAVGAPA